MQETIQSMPQNDMETIMERIRLEMPLYAKGKNPDEIVAIMQKAHGITTTKKQFYNDLSYVRKGKYLPNTYLDDLLDINYPQIYTEIISGLHEDLEYFNDIADNADKTGIKLKAKKYHSDVSINLLNALHKGPVVREMRKLKKKSREMVEELAAERAITRSNKTEAEIIQRKDAPVVSPPPPGEDEEDVDLEDVDDDVDADEIEEEIQETS